MACIQLLCAAMLIALVYGGDDGAVQAAAPPSPTTAPVDEEAAAEALAEAELKLCGTEENNKDESLCLTISLSPTSEGNARSCVYTKMGKPSPCAPPGKQEEASQQPIFPIVIAAIVFIGCIFAISCSCKKKKATKFSEPDQGPEETYHLSVSQSGH